MLPHRCYRIGQKKEVIVYRMLAAGTVEEKLHKKPIYKDGIRRTVFPSATTSAGGVLNIQRYFATDELRQLFVLADLGVCTVMGKMAQHVNWSGQSYVLQHRCTVRLSCHDGFYNPVDEEDESDKTPPPTPEGCSPAVGCSKRVKRNKNAIVVDLVDNDEDADDNNVATYAKMDEFVVLDDSDEAAAVFGGNGNYALKELGRSSAAGKENSINSSNRNRLENRSSSMDKKRSRPIFPPAQQH